MTSTTSLSPAHASDLYYCVEVGAVSLSSEGCAENVGDIGAHTEDKARRIAQSVIGYPVSRLAELYPMTWYEDALLTVGSDAVVTGVVICAVTELHGTIDRYELPRTLLTRTRRIVIQDVFAGDLPSPAEYARIDYPSDLDQYGCDHWEQVSHDYDIGDDDDLRWSLSADAAIPANGCYQEDGVMVSWELPDPSLAALSAGGSEWFISVADVTGERVTTVVTVPVDLSLDAVGHVDRVAIARNLHSRMPAQVDRDVCRRVISSYFADVAVEGVRGLL